MAHSSAATETNAFFSMTAGPAEEKQEMGEDAQEPILKKANTSKRVDVATAAPKLFEKTKDKIEKCHRVSDNVRAALHGALEGALQLEGRESHGLETYIETARGAAECHLPMARRGGRCSFDGSAVHPRNRTHKQCRFRKEAGGS